MGGGRTGGGSQGPGEACGLGALGHICRAGGLGGGCQSKAGQRREGGAPLAGQFRPPAGGTSSPSGSSAFAFLVVSNVTVCGTHGRPRAPSRSDISSSGTHSLRYASEFNTFLAERMYRFIKSELTAPNNRSAGTEAMWTVVQRAGLMKRSWKTSDIYIVACWNSICRAPGPAPRIPHRQLRGRDQEEGCGRLALWEPSNFPVAFAGISSGFRTHRCLVMQGSFPFVAKGVSQGGEGGGPGPPASSVGGGPGRAVSRLPGTAGRGGPWASLGMPGSGMSLWSREPFQIPPSSPGQMWVMCSFQIRPDCPPCSGAFLELSLAGQGG